MDSLENIIKKNLENNCKQKMLTFDFKFGKKVFCYCIDNKISVDDFEKILLFVKKNNNPKDIRYYKYRQFYYDNISLYISEQGNQKCTKKIPHEIQMLNNVKSSILLSVSKKLTLPSHLFSCKLNYDNIEDEEVISINIRKLFKLNLSVITKDDNSKIYSVYIQFIYNKTKHLEKIDQISKFIALTIKNIDNILNENIDDQFKKEILVC